MAGIQVGSTSREAQCRADSARESTPGCRWRKWHGRLAHVPWRASTGKTAFAGGYGGQVARATLLASLTALLGQFNLSCSRERERSCERERAERTPHSLTLAPHFLYLHSLTLAATPFMKPR